MIQLFAVHTLLPDGWARDVRLLIDDQGRLCAVLPESQPTVDDQVHDVLIPAMPNLHSHAFQRAMAGLAEFMQDPRDSFWTWRHTMYSFARQIDPEHLFAIAQQVYCEMLEAGYTSVAEFHYLHQAPAGGDPGYVWAMAEALMEAAASVGMGLTLLPTLYRRGGFNGEPLAGTQGRFYHEVDDFCRFLERLHHALALRPHQRLGMALHSLRAVSLEDAIRATSVFRELEPRGPIHIHIAEQQKEVDACLEVHGQRPVSWLLDHMDVDAHWCLVHATHMDADECRRLASSGAVAGLCPTTEANLGDGLFSLPAYNEAGGRFGIGSDSHISISPIEELRWLEYGQRLHHQRRNMLASMSQPHVGENLWLGAVAGGSQALGHRAEGIHIGQRADLLSLNPDHPLLVNRKRGSLLDSFVFSGNQSAIRETLTAGQVRCLEGRHQDRSAIAATYRKTMTALQSEGL